MNYIRFVFLLTLSSLGVVQAQAPLNATQYMYNRAMFNPAYAGSRGVGNFVLGHRTQLTGFTNAPNNTFFSYDTPIINSLGGAVMLSNRAVGPLHQIDGSLNASYTIPIFSGVFWSVGVRAGLGNLSIDYSRLNVRDENDKALQGVRQELYPVLGLGSFFRGQNWYLGISFFDIRQVALDENKRTYLGEHLFASAGYVFSLGNVKLKPDFSLRYFTGGDFNFNASLSTRIINRLDLGMSYRHNLGYSFLGFLKITEKIALGYSYDLDTNELGAYHDGGHEVYLRYDLLKSLSGSYSERFF